MTSSARDRAAALFGTPIPSASDRRAAGKALRTGTPRTSHAGWAPSAGRPDPIEMLVESNRSRQQDLVPLRYQRMAMSPFAFLRGSALVMAHDLATTPTSGPKVRLCGDAHITNFGVFASPERRLVFDLNDFDETFPGPFEWDVKRLAASIVVAGRERGMGAPETRDAVIQAIGEYRDRLEQYSRMSALDVFYARLETDELLARLQPDLRRRTHAALRRTAGKNNMKALAKLTELVDGKRQIRPDPPLVERFGGPELQTRLIAVIDGYVASLSEERRELILQYRFVDFARKVVGVGSVGTRCFIILLQGPNGGPLFLQAKEAQQPSPQLALGARPYKHQGQRVVEGQRDLQAVSDVMLGWSSDRVAGIDYYIRQLWDAKGSTDIAALNPTGFLFYVKVCAHALARGHASTGDANTLSGYVGTSDTFGRAIAEFAEDYADQTELDHAALVRALKSGALPSTVEPAIID